MKWISVKQKLPAKEDNDDEYLVTDGKIIDLAVWTDMSGKQKNGNCSAVRR